MNYMQDQTCFNRWDDPIHDGTVTQKVVNQVKHEIDRDVLGCKKPRWNPTVGIVGHPTGDLHQINLFLIKKGLKDETITAPKAQTVYEGTNTRDAAYSGWNVSV